ncbi:MAG TPA: SIR2 family protein [Candidatus Saccharimonadales bacterium]|nr:SIR2 family protein [Candidatus Saccharimonadales bacterium]
MEFEAALAYAAQGRAVLFLGAGFSWGATSLAGEPFLMGAGLGKALANEAGIPSDLALEDISDIYMAKYGSAVLLQKLRNLYVAKDVTKSQRELAKLPWRRVYTTNYDDVFERACTEIGKKVASYGGKDPVGKASNNSLTCVHLNGFIWTATEDSLARELKLTTTSYSSGSAMNDESADRFRFDLHAAQAIFFVGYSLADLDLKRLLFEEELKEKSFFVLKKDPNLADAHRASLFGLLVAKGVDAFADEVAAFLKTYSVPHNAAPISHCIKPYTPSMASDPIEDRHLFELLLSGKLRGEYIAPAYLKQVTYCGIRTAVQRFSEVLVPGVGVIYFHSSLGNGKTVAMAFAHYAAFVKGFQVFTLANRGDTLTEELHVVLDKGGHAVIFVDNYTEWLDVLSAFRGRVGKELTLVMSARTAAHEALFDRVSDAVGWRDAFEFNLDEMDDDELEWVSAFLDHFGFWNDMAGSGASAKLRFLKDKCDGRWSSVLLKVFEAPQMVERLAKLFQAFNETSEYKDALTKLLLLSVLGYHPNSPTLITLCGDEILTRGFKENAVVSELIDFAGNTFNMRSSVMATVILKKISDPNRTAQALIRLISQVDVLAYGSDYHFELFKNLVRFSGSNLFFPEESRGRSAMRVYEEIKGLGHCSRNPLFWLQYAIAALVAKDFERSGFYFSTAYSHASNLDRYDSFQIDNHYARFLLERAIDTDFNAADRMAPFREARGLLRPQFADEWRHYPYRVATAYFGFLTRFSANLASPEKQEIKGAATEIIERIAKLPLDRQAHRSVHECYVAQFKIVRIVDENSI